MSYYQGDYYQGDYYQGDHRQGDPFLGALIGMGATWLGKKLLGKAAAKGAIATAGSAALVTGGAGVVTGGIVGAAAPWALTAGKDIFMSLKGRMTGAGRPAMAGMPGCAPSICCPTGYHPNKQTSHAKATFGAEPGTICVRNRAMNVANPRALRRGLRRVSGFGKLAARARTSVKKAARSM